MADDLKVKILAFLKDFKTIPCLENLKKVTDPNDNSLGEKC